MKDIWLKLRTWLVERVFNRFNIIVFVGLAYWAGGGGC